MVRSFFFNFVFIPWKTEIKSNLKINKRFYYNFLIIFCRVYKEKALSYVAKFAVRARFLFKACAAPRRTKTAHQNRVCATAEALQTVVRTIIIQFLIN